MRVIGSAVMAATLLWSSSPAAQGPMRDGWAFRHQAPVSAAALIFFGWNRWIGRRLLRAFPSPLIRRLKSHSSSPMETVSSSVPPVRSRGMRTDESGSNKRSRASVRRQEREGTSELSRSRLRRTACSIGLMNPARLHGGCVYHRRRHREISPVARRGHLVQA